MWSDVRVLRRANAGLYTMYSDGNNIVRLSFWALALWFGYNVLRTLRTSYETFSHNRYSYHWRVEYRVQSTEYNSQQRKLLYCRDVDFNEYDMYSSLITHHSSTTNDILKNRALQTILVKK